MGKSEKKKSVADVASAFIAGLDEQIKEAEARKVKKTDTTPFDTAVLDKIGDAALKRAVDSLSFAQLHSFLKQSGFMGDRARLADLLAQKGIRAKGEVPEHFKKKCAACGKMLVDDRPDPKEKRIWICLECGMTHELSKGRLIQKGVLSPDSLDYVRKEKGWQSKVHPQGQSAPQGQRPQVHAKTQG